MNAVRAVSPTVQRAWDLLESITDPEIPVVSLRELGVLREVRETGDTLEVVITPTYSGCPAMGQIEDDVHALLDAHGLRARVVTRLAPAWTTDWIGPEAKRKLHDYGIAPPHAVPQAVQVVRFMSRRAAQAVACPRCGSTDTVVTSEFGSTSCKALYRCQACREPFDYFKPY